MSSLKLTDTDYEIIEMLKWIRKEFRIVVIGKENQWIVTDDIKWDPTTEKNIMEHYKIIKEDAKHKTHNKLSK
jgi:hypothetical protein